LQRWAAAEQRRCWPSQHIVANGIVYAWYIFTIAQQWVATSTTIKPSEPNQALEAFFSPLGFLNYHIPLGPIVFHRSSLAFQLRKAPEKMK